MSKFKVGDVVRRISFWGEGVKNFGGMHIGDRGVVYEVERSGSVRVEGFLGWHSDENLELVRNPYPNPPHKHAELIKAWADGAEIEANNGGGWERVSRPLWYGDSKYRIKPANPNAEKIAELEKTIDQAKKQLQELKNA